MCWSGEASAVLATVGLTSTAYFYHKKEAIPLCFALGYFSLMEALQAFTYIVIDDCTSPANQIATMLGYLHIAFQPFFINAVSLYFIPAHVRNKISWLVYIICFATSILFIMRIFPFDWAPVCTQVKYKVPLLSQYIDSFSVPFCGEKICSLSGDWHIAWEIPAISNPIMDNAYLVSAFILPVLYGSWKMTVYHILVGPFLAYITTNNPNEWVAVWCLYSIGLLLLLLKTPIRDYLHVKSWYGLKYPWQG